MRSNILFKRLTPNSMWLEFYGKPVDWSIPFGVFLYNIEYQLPI